MVTVETTGKVRRLLAQGVSISEIARLCCVCRNTVRKIRDKGIITPQYKKRAPRPSILDNYTQSLQKKLESDQQLKPRERRKAIVLYEELQREGYDGSYDTVRRFVRDWLKTNKGKHSAFVPLVFKKGEAFQFDWSTETVLLGGIPIKVQAAHVRLCHSRMPFVAVFPRQSMEMLLEAHVLAHDFYEGLCGRGIYDNLKTVVSHIGQGRTREFNKRYLALASHYLIEPTACTPASGNEKGQVEQQVDTLRDHFFTPRLNFKSCEEVNAHLAEQCRYKAMTTKHPEFTDKTIWEVFQDEKPYLKRQSTRFEAFTSTTKSVTSTCFVPHDHNYYSVPCEYANRGVEVRIYANKIVIAHDGVSIATHERRFGRGGYSMNLEHYLPLLERKPGAVRNGRPFIEDNLPAPFGMLRDVLLKTPGGEKQFAHILLAIRDYGQDAVMTATEIMLEAGIANETTILNAVSRLAEEAVPPEISIPQKLELECEPSANCQQYDLIRETGHAS